MDVRWYLTLAVSGLILPVATVLAAISTAIRVEFPPQLTLVLLLALPLLAIVTTYAMALYSGLSVPFADRLPFGDRRQFRDEIPERYHATFAPETLDEPTEPDDGPNTIVTAYLVYLVSIPAYTLIVWLLVLG